MLEVHLFDFDGEIYGKHVRVDFLHKLRDEEKYADLETLTRQIALDVENAKAFFDRQDAKSAKRPSAECSVSSDVNAIHLLFLTNLTLTLNLDAD